LKLAVEWEDAMMLSEPLKSHYVVALEYCFYGSMKLNITNNFNVAETYFRFKKHGGYVEQCDVNLNSTVSNLVEIRSTGSRYIYRGMIFLHSVIKITPTMAYTAYTVSRGGAVGTVTAYGLDDRGVGVRVPVGSKFSLLHIVQTGSRIHPASYSMGTGVSFPGGKAAGS
jgi:hypothetical protein